MCDLKKTHFAVVAAPARLCRTERQSSSPLAGCQEYLPASQRLAAALARFNERFDYHLRVPIWPETLESAAELAGLRGQPELAAELRSLLSSQS